ncbi:HAD-IA family hydrolase [Aliiglaciecola litoralis]|uniref:HAD family hydrolase n=1 Tax=Aliiglaciecola litoralis TaxID=582857 RepID=A0ABP3WMU0_9ALTE
MSKQIAAIKGFIFDLDGTLMHANLDFEYLRQAVGCPMDTDILTHVDGLNHELRTQALHIIIQHEIEDACTASWINGAAEFVQRIADDVIPMAIVTRNCRQAAQRKLADSIQHFEVVLTREDALPKPDPDALLKIAKQWQIPVSGLAYIGDYLYDVQAANRAGMLSCLYAPNGVPDYADQADIVFSDFAQLATWLD